MEGEITKKSWINDFFNFSLKEPVNKLAFSDEDAEYKCKIIKKMQDIGMKVTIDDVGNICGTIGKSDPNFNSIVMGSHTDSVPNGGQFDGSAGVIAALKAVENLLEYKKEIKGLVKVIIYTCEESSRFNTACLGSKYLSEAITKDKLSSIVDKHGMKLNYAIEDYKFFIRMHKENYELDEIERVEKVLLPNECDNALELHIEQYESLKESDYQIGIVNSIVAPFRMKIKIIGEQGHTGTTPIEKRKDAVLAGALFTNSINQLSMDDNNKLRATIPQFETQKWSANVIQDEVELFLDVRMQYPNTPEDVKKMIKKTINEIEISTNTKFECTVVTSDTPVKTNEQFNEILLKHCKELKLKAKPMPSWAGHDIAHVPIENKTLIFIPSTGGSHHPNESITEADLENGIELIYKTLLELDI